MFITNIWYLIQIIITERRTWIITLLYTKRNLRIQGRFTSQNIFYTVRICLVLAEGTVKTKPKKIKRKYSNTEYFCLKHWVNYGHACNDARLMIGAYNVARLCTCTISRRKNKNKNNNNNKYHLTIIILHARDGHN